MVRQRIENHENLLIVVFAILDIEVIESSMVVEFFLI